MSFHDLREFLTVLEREGELHRVMAEVDPVLEIAAITERISKSEGGGKALLFERVKNSALPVATNLFGSPRRTAMALGVKNIQELAGSLPLMAPADAPGKRSTLAQLLDDPRWQPIVEHEPLCQEIVEEDSALASLPVLKCWPDDGFPNGDGRFITLPLVFTRDLLEGSENCGMYRVCLFGDSRVGINWRPGSGGHKHYQHYSARSEAMPVAVAVGGPPAVLFAAAMPLPEDVDEVRFAGLLQKKPVAIARCLTVPLSVPASAELVIEGFVDPGEKRNEGFFANHTGYYRGCSDVPIMQVTCVTRRKDALYPATVVGQPPMEDCHMAKGIERLSLGLLRQLVPEVVDINMPMEWIFQPAAFVSVRKTRPGHGRELLAKLRREPLLRHARLLAVLDCDVDVQDVSATAWKVMNCVDFSRDILFFDEGKSLAVDATRKLEGEVQSPLREARLAEETLLLIKSRWKEYGF